MIRALRTGGLSASTLLAFSLLLPLASLGTHAAAAEAGDAKTTQQKCDGTSQDRAACLREAGAAAQERRSDGLTDPAPKQQQKNATERCANQPAAAQSDCEARMKDGPNTKSEGSVAGGGIIRETVTPASAPR